MVRTLGYYQPFCSLMAHGKDETRWVRKGKKPPFPLGTYLHYSTKLRCTNSQLFEWSGPELMLSITQTLEGDVTRFMNGYALSMGDLVELRPMVKEDEAKAFVKFVGERTYTDNKGIMITKVQWILRFENVRAIQPIRFFQGKQGVGKLTDELAATLKPPTMNSKQQAIFEMIEAVERGAEFSECGKHRYALWRIWDRSKPLAMFIGLNPSTANADSDDPTIQSVTRLSRFNGYGGFYMMNCWSYIATEPKDLDTCAGNIENAEWLGQISNKCKDVIFAWGNFKIVIDHRRDRILSGMFPNAKCIGQNKNGSPSHPLFKKGTTIFIEYWPVIN